MEWKKGQWVKVWSLQSFFNGGFLCGERAFLRQSQHGNEGSIILCVIRNFNGVYKVDESYGVYKEQCKLLKDQEKAYHKAPKKLRKFYYEIMKNTAIS
jgi:hypothetical protein